jgi:hypothetical protein
LRRAWEQCGAMMQQTLPKIPPHSLAPDIAAAGQAVSPLIREIAFRDPLELFAPFANDRHAVLLESAVTDGQRGRYSYIAVEPFQILSSKNGNIALGERALQGNPFDLLDEQLRRFKFSPAPDLPPFQGGVSAISAMSLPSIWSACRWRALTRCSFQIW